MSSVIGSFYTLSACIDQVPLELEEWRAWNDNQKKYLAIYRNCMGANIPEIQSKVSKGDVEPVNSFLNQRGFDIQLSQIGPEDLAIASVLEVLLKWMSKGKKATIYFGPAPAPYKGVSLSDGVLVQYFAGFKNPVAAIKTKNGDTVYMTVPAVAPADSFETFELARKLISELGTHAEGYEQRVVFPKIDLDVQPDISWIVGMSDEHKEKWMIAQAMQQTKVKMDEEGVIIKEAVAIGARCMSCAFTPEIPLIIDKPFLFVVQREGLKEPLFSAYLDRDGWIPEK